MTDQINLTLLNLSFRKCGITYHHGAAVRLDNARAVPSTVPVHDGGGAVAGGQ